MKVHARSCAHRTLKNTAPATDLQTNTLERYATGDQVIDQKVVEPGELPKGKWVKLQLPFGIPGGIFKMERNGEANLGAGRADTQLFLDDLEVVKKK